MRKSGLSLIGLVTLLTMVISCTVISTLTGETAVDGEVPTLVPMAELNSTHEEPGEASEPADVPAADADLPGAESAASFTTFETIVNRSNADAMAAPCDFIQDDGTMASFLSLTTFSVSAEWEGERLMYPIDWRCYEETIDDWDFSGFMSPGDGNTRTAVFAFGHAVTSTIEPSTLANASSLFLFTPTTISPDYQMWQFQRIIMSEGVIQSTVNEYSADKVLQFAIEENSLDTLLAVRDEWMINEGQGEQIWIDVVLIKEESPANDVRWILYVFGKPGFFGSGAGGDRQRTICCDWLVCSTAGTQWRINVCSFYGCWNVSCF